jgi:hypothetical protein
LVREGFSWGALLFGPFWLAAHRAWIAAALVMAADILILALTSGATGAALMLGLSIWLGLSGQDLRRSAMQHRGFRSFDVAAARDEGEAIARILDRRPELAGSFLPPGAG